MGFIILKVKMDTEEVEKVIFPPNHYWTFDIKKSDGDDIRERITVCRDDKIEIPNSKATANFTVRWEDAKNHSSINIAEPSRSGPLKGKKLDGEYPGNSSGGWVDIIAFECRGAEPIKWYPTQDYVVESSKGNILQDVDLTDDWCDYDNEGGVQCGIYNLEWELYHVK